MRIDIDELIDAIHRSGLKLNSDARLRIPDAPRPFIRPKLVAEQSSLEQTLGAEVIIVSSPAAVGKSTAARFVAATCGLPLLDLADVHVSTNALVGLLTMDILQPKNPLSALHKGELTVVVDALDEGRMLSGDANFEQFLTTVWELLGKDRRVPDRPKLILFGRDGAAELADMSLQIEAPDLRTSWVRLDFFDHDDAVEVIEGHAAETAHTAGRQWSSSAPHKAVIDAYFAAIASAIHIDSGELWTDAQGRAFAGYAPVLAAIGSLLAREENPIKLQNALQASGADRAWEVIETVAETILVREQEEKVVPQLAKELTGALPAEAYDRTEQLTYLTQLALGRPPKPTGRVNLAGKDFETYRRMVNQHLQDHPFLQQGRLANDVLAAIVLADAVVGDLVETADLSIFRTASRQPFLWRAVQRNLQQRSSTLLQGRYVGCVLNSLWNDAYAQTYRVRARADEILSNHAQFEVAEPNGKWEIVASHPIEFYEQVMDLDGRLTGDVILQGHSKERESASFDIRGDVALLAKGIDVRATAVRLDGEARLSAERIEQPPDLRLYLAPNTTVWWGGRFRSHPWDQHEATLEAPDERPPASELAALLERLSVSVPRGAPITVHQGTLELTEDLRTSWIQRDFDAKKFAELLRLLITTGYARDEASGASGPQPLVRVRFDMGWDELLRAVRRPDLVNDELRLVVESAKSIFDR